MKTGILLASVFLCSLPLLADDTKSTPSTIEELVKRRISILTEIVETTKRQHDAGQATEAEVLDATLELYTLNRDSSKPLAQQISWQERIVALERQRQASLEQLRSSGAAGPTEVLRATERVLAAEQKRLELEARK